MADVHEEPGRRSPDSSRAHDPDVHRVLPRRLSQREGASNPGALPYPEERLRALVSSSEREDGRATAASLDRSQTAAPARTITGRTIDRKPQRYCANPPM